MSKSDNERRDEVLRRMLKTPHKPHKPLKANANPRRTGNDTGKRTNIRKQ